MLVAVALSVSGCVKQGVPTGDDVRGHIAEAYGIQSLSRIQKMQYTFNQKAGDQSVRRFWIWEPGTDRVTYKGGDYQPAVSYLRKDLSDASETTIKQIDQWFLHDNYLLMLPFRVAWDHQAQVADMGLCQASLAAESARCVNVVYPSKVEGHIIGDTYKLFLNGEYRILESIYQPANAPRQEGARLWTRYRFVGPILLSLAREDGEGRTLIRFTGVGVQLEGDKWYWAE